MRINHNISALKANNQLARTNKNLDSSLEKLSSGYRINHAADDAAGLAISEKMKTQIAGLDQASRNASDGISVIQTAEGALIEVENMLQRMRELAVQSANGTYTANDRSAVQSEIDQLSQEIARISDTTEFNTMPLLDGNVDRKSFADNKNVKLVSLSDTVAVGKYTVKIAQDARKAILVGNKTISTGGPDPSIIQDGQAGTININGESVEAEVGDSVIDIFEKLRDTCGRLNVDLYATADGTHADTVDEKHYDMAGYTSKQFATGDFLVFMSKEYGASELINIESDNPDLAAIFGLNIKCATAQGIDAKATVEPKADPPVKDGSLFNNTATVSIKGNEITITDKDDFKMILEANPGTAGSTFDDTNVDDGTTDSSDNVKDAGKEIAVNVSVLDAGPMDLQIGANEGQTMSVRIPEVTPTTLGIDNINLETADGAQEAIGLLDKAVNAVSAIRSKLGAYQNRLEHSISNLDVTSENMSESLSRIEDVDMAEEMANYTQKNVLAQAGTSMLAQANQRPQTVLTLLQQ